jgi:hypothetical protein
MRRAFFGRWVIFSTKGQKPAVTILLLNYLEANMQEGVVSKEILDLKSFIKARTVATI